eukprot:COSAG01_NODE_36903_length_511_cov_0.825243_1_plen_82_part_00
MMGAQSPRQLALLILRSLRLLQLALLLLVPLTPTATSCRLKVAVVSSFRGTSRQYGNATAHIARVPYYGKLLGMENYCSMF